MSKRKQTSSSGTAVASVTRKQPPRPSAEIPAALESLRDRLVTLGNGVETLFARLENGGVLAAGVQKSESEVSSVRFAAPLANELMSVVDTVDDLNTTVKQLLDALQV